MSDDTQNSRPLGDEARIDAMIGEAVSPVELILNAEFLLGEWITCCLKNIPQESDIFREMGLTPEQRFYVAVGDMGCFEDEEHGGQAVFQTLSRIYRLRSKLGRISSEALLDALCAELCAVWGPGMKESLDGAPDRFVRARGCWRNNMEYAYSWISAHITTTKKLRERDSSH
jgi:hypothetical protein